MSESSPISEEDVRRVASLARLSLAEEEIQSLVQDLGGILEYVKKLDELDTDDVEATAHAVELPTKLRVDETHEGLPLELGLRGAPEKIGGGFGVPKIIE